MIWLVLFVIALAVIAFSLRYGWWRPAAPAGRPRILMYHMVADHRPGAAFNKLRVPPDTFERQVRWLAHKGYYFAFMSELAGDEPLPEKTVAITFDDGYEDNLVNAHPVLEKYRARATLYLVEERFDRDWSVYKKAHHDSGELMRERKLTDQQVTRMLSSGVWQLGGHTTSHANLNKLSESDKANEIADSKKRLERTFHTTLSSFAYPFGIYSDADIRHVREAGFDTAVTTVEGIDESIAANPFELKRIKMSGKDNWLAFLMRMRTGIRG